MVRRARRPGQARDNPWKPSRQRDGAGAVAAAVAGQGVVIGRLPLLAG